MVAERWRLCPGDCLKWRKRVCAPSRFTSLMFYPCQLWIRYSIGFRIRSVWFIEESIYFEDERKNREVRLYKWYLKFCGCSSRAPVPAIATWRANINTALRKSVDPKSKMWNRLLSSVSYIRKSELSSVAHDYMFPIVNNSGRVNKITHRVHVMLTLSCLTYTFDVLVE